MFFKDYAITLLFLVLAVSTSLFGMEPWYRPVADYASRHKGKIAAGVGAAAALGGLYYGYQQGWLQSGANIQLGSGYILRGNLHNWRFEHREDKEFNPESISLVHIENEFGYGDIDVSSYEGNKVRLEIHKRAETQEALQTVSAEITETAQNLNIRTKYSQSLVQALINYKLQIPRNKIINLKLINDDGAIKVSNINGNVSLVSDDGNIDATNIQGVFNAKSDDGHVTLSGQNIDFPVTIKTDDGNIALQAQVINGRLLANTDDGKIKSDFPFENRIIKKSAKPAKGQPAKTSKKRVDAILGNGGPDIKLSTDDGNITLLRQ